MTRNCRRYVEQGITTVSSITDAIKPHTQSFTKVVKRVACLRQSLRAFVGVRLCQHPEQRSADRTIMQMQLPLLEKSEALPFMWRCQLMEDMFRACKLLLNLLVFVAFCDSLICRNPGG